MTLSHEFSLLNRQIKNVILEQVAQQNSSPPLSHLNKTSLEEEKKNKKQKKNKKTKKYTNPK